MKNAIEKAIEGGWDWCKRFNYPPNCTFGELEMEYIKAYWELALLDPLFWQALIGKDVLYIDYAYGKHRPYAWLKEMHSSIDHIAEGKSIDEFFNNLLK